MTIKGDVEEGDYVKGVYYDCKGKKIKDLKVDIVEKLEMPVHKLDKDPYESETVKVLKTEGKGEGSFAKRDIPSGQLCALYSGMLVPHYIVDRRRWEFNDNTIEADDKYSIDVPPDCIDRKNYWASLGHKANHSFEPNAKYMHLYHPKFGDIMSVISIKNIAKDEEIVVNYGYAAHSRGPKWFREAKKWYDKEQKKKEILKRRKKKSKEWIKRKILTRKRTTIQRKLIDPEVRPIIKRIKQ